MGGGGQINGFMANTEYMSENPTPTPIPAFGSGVVGRGRGGKRGEGDRGVEMGGGGEMGGRKGRLRGIGEGGTGDRGSGEFSPHQSHHMVTTCAAKNA
jgi:hypothetical protein